MTSLVIWIKLEPCASEENLLKWAVDLWQTDLIKPIDIAVTWNKCCQIWIKK